MLVAMAKNKQSISGSTVGAASVGDGSRASATGTASGLTTEQWRHDIEALQVAMVRDQDAMTDLAEGMYEGFSQVLRLLRDLDVDGEEAAVLQRQIKDAVDDVWASNELRKLRQDEVSPLAVFKAAAQMAGPAAQILHAIAPI
jgi:hypothetical protein